MSYPFLAARVFNTPLLMDPAKAEVILSALAPRLGLEAFADVDGHTRPMLGPEALAQHMQIAEDNILRRTPTDRPFLFDERTGIASIAIDATLAHRQGFIGRSSGVMGYDGLSAQLTAAMRDDRVRGVLLDVHSAGGEAAGAFDLAAKIRAANDTKPVWAVANEAAFSAAYLLSSAAQAVFATRTAEVGSIGVVRLHLDRSEQLDKRGIKPTFIIAGARKIDGTSLLPLSDSARARAQEEVNATAQIFYETVANYRGLEAGAVQAQEAGIFRSPEAMGLGLIDEIGSVDEVEESFGAYLNGPRRVIV